MKNQKGFTIVEILILLVVAGAIGATGWFVSSRSSKADEDSRQASTSSEPSTQSEASDTQDDGAVVVKEYTYRNTLLNYGFDYSSGYTTIFGSDSYGVDDLKKSYSIALVQNNNDKPSTSDQVLEVVMDLSPSIAGSYDDASARQALLNQGIHAIASASHKINKDYDNPNVKDTVGELMESKVGNLQAYYFDVTGDFSYGYTKDGGGTLVYVPVRVYFVQDSNKNVFRIMDFKQNDVSKQILQSFGFNL